MKFELVHKGTPSQQFLPLLAMVNAGDPTADDHVEERLDIAEMLIVRPDVTFFVRVDGEVLDDPSIRSGDILVVDRSVPARPGDTIIATIAQEFVIRVLPKGLRIVPPGHSNHLDVWGVVLWIIHKAY